MIDERDHIVMQLRKAITIGKPVVFESGESILLDGRDAKQALRLHEKIERSTDRRAFEQALDESFDSFAMAIGHNLDEMQSDNEGGGYHGSALRHAKYGITGNKVTTSERAYEKAGSEFAKMHRRVKRVTGEKDDLKVRNFLDSVHGRHIHDAQLGKSTTGSELDKHIASRHKEFSKTYHPSQFEEVQVDEGLHAVYDVRRGVSTSSHTSLSRAKDTAELKQQATGQTAHVHSIGEDGKVKTVHKLDQSGRWKKTHNVFEAVKTDAERAKELNAKAKNLKKNIERRLKKKGVTEELVNELSAKTLKAYADKAEKDSDRLENRAFRKSTRPWTGSPNQRYALGAADHQKAVARFSSAGRARRLAAAKE